MQHAPPPAIFSGSETGRPDPVLRKLPANPLLQSAGLRGSCAISWFAVVRALLSCRASTIGALVVAFQPIAESASASALEASRPRQFPSLLHAYLASNMRYIFLHEDPLVPCFRPSLATRVRTAHCRRPPQTGTRSQSGS